MKRGLVRWADTDEAAAEFAARLEQLRHALRRHDVQVGLLYGDVETAQPLTYLTNVCVYWGHALLVVPTDGDAVLLTSSSKRVHPWIVRSSVLEEVHTTADLGGTAAEHVAAAGYQAVGVVDQRSWPSSVVSRFAAAAGPVTVSDLGPLARRMQVVPSPRQRAGLTDAARLCHEGFAAFRDQGGDTASRVGAAEYAVRMGGATDAQITPFAGRRADAEWVEVRCHLASEWSAVHGFVGAAADGGGDSVGDDIARGFAAWLSQLEPGMGVAEAEQAAETALDRQCPGTAGVRGRLLAHADIETGGALGSSLAPGPLPADAVLHASIDVRTPAGQLIRVGDTVAIDPGGARVLGVASG